MLCEDTCQRMWPRKSIVLPFQIADKNGVKLKPVVRYLVVPIESVGSLRVLFVALFFLQLANVGVAAPEFKAAAGQTDITPPLGQLLWGYSDRKQGATNVLNPLFARVLVLDDGSNRLALVTLD